MNTEATDRGAQGNPATGLLGDPHVSAVASVLNQLDFEESQIWILFHTPTAQKAAEDMLARIRSALTARACDARK